MTTRPHHTARAGRMSARPRRARARHAELAAHLTTRDRWLLGMLAEHRVLTTTQLVGLGFPSPRAAQLRLATLRELGLIDCFQPLLGLGSAPMHWVLDTPGAEVLTAQHATDEHTAPSRPAVRRTERRADRRPDRHRRRRPAALALAHSNQLAHLLGVNTWMTSLATTAAAAGDPDQLALEVWWSQARCAACFADFARPDAYALWQQGGTRLGFFLEYDTGSEAPRQLAAKLPGYHHLAAATAITTPVLFALPTPGRETTARRALTQALTALPDPHLVPVATTYTPPHSPPRSPPHTPSRARAHPEPGPSLGLAGPVWQPLHPGRTHPAVGDPGQPRVSLAALGALWRARTGPHHHANQPAPPHGPATSSPDAPTPMPPPAPPHPARGA